MKRVFIIVADSLGIGGAKDEHQFGDKNVNTLHSITAQGANIPTLTKIGIGLLGDFNIEKVNKPIGYVRRLEEASLGKDTMTGHWELMGLYVKEAFQTFTDTGFPDELLDEITRRSGVSFIGNYAASGTEIIKDLGEEHIASGKAIVYTSADSVLQIAAHEKHFGLENLYKVCEISRELTLEGKYRLGRIIARPFLGDNASNFKRTVNRHDYALSPVGKTYLDYYLEAGLDVISVGKIYDIFNGHGLSEKIKSISNEDGMNKIIELTERDFNGVVFANLVDFDMEYGHRRDVAGYRKALEQFDDKLKELIAKLREDDVVIICADHGNDPAAPGTDHTRENVPFIIYSKSFTSGGRLPDGQTFADVGALVADIFDLKCNLNGTSVKKYLK